MLKMEPKNPMTYNSPGGKVFKFVLLTLVICIVIAAGYAAACQLDQDNIRPICLFRPYESNAGIPEKTQPGEGNKTIEDVIKEHTNELMSIPGVTGVGQGLCDGDPCVLILLIRQTPELSKTLPTVLDGYKVKIQVTGKIEAH